jgi:hypothetical protein
MTKKSTLPETSAAEKYTADRVRLDSLAALDEIQNSSLDMGRLTDPVYLSSMTPAQLARVKKVITDRNGVIVSVELYGMVDLIVAKANIAGVKEKSMADAKERAAIAAAKAKEKEEKKKEEKHRSNKLVLLVGNDKKDPASPGKDEKKSEKTGHLADLISKKS